jgi:release factor glutamine methyltransferase
VRIGEEVQALPRPGRLSEGNAFTALTTRAEAFRRLVEAFRDLNFDEPAREARLTLCAACGLSPTAMIAAPDERLGQAAARLGEFAVRRADGEPLSKIIGRREFWGLPLFVSRDVLDPRPETETIVEAAVALFAGRRSEPIRVLDLGVGSGALLCALLIEFPAARGLGVDRSEAAAAVARANIEACGLAERAEVRIGDWADGVDGPFDLIVSNPPYVPSGDIANLPREVRDHDPRAALDGGADGLEAFRAILPASAVLLSPDGRLIVEVGAGQARSVLAMAAEAGFRDAAKWRDLAGVERAVAGRSPRRV